jgi:hypothetical protein
MRKKVKIKEGLVKSIIEEGLAEIRKALTNTVEKIRQIASESEESIFLKSGGYELRFFCDGVLLFLKSPIDPYHPSTIAEWESREKFDIKKTSIGIEDKAKDDSTVMKKLVEKTLMEAIEQILKAEEVEID